MKKVLQPVPRPRVLTEGQRLAREVWISPAQIGELLGVSKMTVYRILDRDEMEYVRAGRTIRVTRSSFERWLAQGGTEKDEAFAPSKLQLA